MKAKKVPEWISAPLAVGAFAALVLWERRRPLRRAVEPKLRRNLRNLTVAGLGAAAHQLAAVPILVPLARTVERRRWGLLRRRRERFKVLANECDDPQSFSMA
jgi:hypothetical protein